MSTIKHMRAELMKARWQGLDGDVRLISDIKGAPKDATQVVILYLALEAARGSYEALAACNALKEWSEHQHRTKKYQTES